MQSFQNKVFSLLKHVPRGRVTTYGEIAKAIGSKCYRAVGNALNKNVDSPSIPCHRVVLSSGELGCFAFGKDKKIELLESEGVLVVNDKIVDFKSKIFLFK